jgi:hypothetical protein
MINNVTNSTADLFKTAHKSEKTEVIDKNPQGNSVELGKDKGDQVTIGSGKDPVVTYNKPLDATQHITMKFQMIQQLVTSLTVNQGATGTISEGATPPNANEQIAQLFNKLGLSTSIDIGGGKTSDLQSMTPDEAQKLIADDGYWGVEQTSSRIADFAIAQIGDDPSKIDKVKAAIMQGFNEAKEAFGGKLPEISQKTIDAVMSKLDKLSAPAS